MHEHGRHQAESKTAPIDRIDPRVRLVSMLIWIVLAAWLNRFHALSIALLLCLAPAALSVVQLKRTLSRVGYLTLAVLPAWIVLPLMGPPHDVMAGAGPVKLHATGLLAAALLQAKATAILAAVMGHQGNTPWNRWVWAAHKLGAPARLLAMLTFTLRYLPLLSEEGKRTHTAALARGFRRKPGRQGYYGLAALAGAGLVRSYYRSERVNRALSARGFQGTLYPLRAERAEGKDAWFIMISTVSACVIICLTYWIL